LFFKRVYCKKTTEEEKGKSQAKQELEGSLLGRSVKILILLQLCKYNIMMNQNKID